MLPHAVSRVHTNHEHTLWLYIFAVSVPPPKRSVDWFPNVLCIVAPRNERNGRGLLLHISCYSGTTPKGHGCSQHPSSKGVTMRKPMVACVPGC